MRLAFRGRLHPRDRVDIAAHCRFNVLDQLLGAGLALRRKDLRHVHLAERLANITIDCACAAPPSRRLLLRAGQYPSERKIGIAPPVSEYA